MMHHEQTIEYVTHQPMTADQVLEKASEIVKNRHLTSDIFTSSQATKDFLQFKLGKYEREVFSMMILSNRHQLIEYKELFFGTIDAASVYPREVVKAVLSENGSAVIFSHNHPSGELKPSQADIAITKRLKEALALIDVQVLDHIIVGDGTTSMAELGLL
jgi:DNA repair protein RadC